MCHHSPTSASTNTDPLSGLLVIDKSVGITSMDVIRRLRRAIGDRKAKAGHAGTLDPLASGVLLCCVGRATKQIDRLMGMTKVYQAQVDLSAFTATDDREGQRQEIAVDHPPDREQLLATLASFVGDIRQQPPIYSAIHIQGQRAYDLARRGKTIDMPSRLVHVDAVDLLDYAWPTATIRVTCGKGTYIRSLARDIGKALHTGGHLASLRRLSVGPYDLSMAIPIDRLTPPIRPADWQTIG